MRECSSRDPFRKIGPHEIWTDCGCDPHHACRSLYSLASQPRAAVAKRNFLYEARQQLSAVTSPTHLSEFCGIT